MIPYRSRTSTHGRNMAGARGLWRATGMTDSDFGIVSESRAREFDAKVASILMVIIFK